MMIKPWQKIETGFEVFIKLTPNASKSAILGIITEANDRCFLKMSVTAIPENNKANHALITFLSKTLRVAKSCIVIKSGATTNRKVVVIEGITSEDLTMLVEKNDASCNNRS